MAYYLKYRPCQSCQTNYPKFFPGPTTYRYTYKLLPNLTFLVTCLSISIPAFKVYQFNNTRSTRTSGNQDHYENHPTLQRTTFGGGGDSSTQNNFHSKSGMRGSRPSSIHSSPGTKSTKPILTLSMA